MYRNDPAFFDNFEPPVETERLFPDAIADMYKDLW